MNIAAAIPFFVFLHKIGRHAHFQMDVIPRCNGEIDGIGKFIAPVPENASLIFERISQIGIDIALLIAIVLFGGFKNKRGHLHVFSKLESNHPSTVVEERSALCSRYIHRKAVPIAIVPLPRQGHQFPSREALERKRRHTGIVGFNHETKKYALPLKLRYRERVIAQVTHFPNLLFDKIGFFAKYSHASLHPYKPDCWPEKPRAILVNISSRFVFGSQPSSRSFEQSNLITISGL